MFNKQDNLNEQQSDKTEEVKDIFAGIDSGEKNGASARFPGMRRNGKKKELSVQDNQLKAQELENNINKQRQDKKRNVIKKITILIIVIFILAIISAAYYYFFYKPQNNKNNGDAEIVNIINTNQPAENGADKMIDSDFDGLTDEEEKILGTDPNFADSDEDGLLDKEEIENYNTDPLNPDTDGDGYSDGQEVKGGYNPLGEGKLKIN
ncbi:hypothetical protein KAI52_02235 [Candidatus Parcubacteria bacterium]|nr:hypothetical protein [Candidatus Parcubacteria bacterium]